MRNTYSDQMYIYLKKFESEIAAMAWSVAGQVFEEQKRKLTTGLINIAIKANKKATTIKAPYKLALLYRKIGTWSRGRGTYRVLGPGQKPKTVALEEIKTGKKINTTIKTLTSRWKHLV